MIGRRQILMGLSGAAVCSFVVRAQQTRTPVIGYLSSLTKIDSIGLTAAFHEGLRKAGYVEGRNVSIEYRWADGRYERLPALASDLVDRRVTVIASFGPASAQAARSMTTTIPIVFVTGSDSVKDGLVESFNRPGGNMTGVNMFVVALGGKRLELLLQLAPNASVIGVLVNPSLPVAESQRSDVRAAARDMAGKQVFLLDATNESEIDSAFTALGQRRADALIVSADPFFYTRRGQILALAARNRLPAIYEFRGFPEAGGLMSYGSNIADAYHQAADYVAKILNGANPEDLPVVQSIRLELVINLNAAKALGITVPPKLLARADEVIE